MHEEQARLVLCQCIGGTLLKAGVPPVHSACIKVAEALGRGSCARIMSPGLTAAVCEEAAARPGRGAGSGRPGWRHCGSHPVLHAGTCREAPAAGCQAQAAVDGGQPRPADQPGWQPPGGMGCQRRRSGCRLLNFCHGWLDHGGCRLAGWLGLGWSWAAGWPTAGDCRAAGWLRPGGCCAAGTVCCTAADAGQCHQHAQRAP